MVIAHRGTIGAPIIGNGNEIRHGGGWVLVEEERFLMIVAEAKPSALDLSIHFWQSGRLIHT
jgi:hypothetical protein